MNSILLTLRMMLRDLRAGELHLLGIAIVIAVASLTSVGFLADRVARGLDREANQLLGGDLLLRADHPWDTAFSQEAARRGLRSVDSVLFTSMVSTDSAAELAAVKVVEPGYPLRGGMRIAPALNTPDRTAERVPEPGEIWLDERLMTVLGVTVGDRVGIGRLTLRVGAVVTFEADRGANFFSLLPRALFNAGDLEASGLLIRGSRATWRLHLAGDIDAVESYAQWARTRMGRGEAVETIDDARPQVRTALDQAQRFLRLAALLAVVLASVAVGLSARRFMRRHLDACAVMRCLGARQRQVLALVVGEFLVFGLCAALVGGILGWGVQGLLGMVLKEVFEAALPPPTPVPLLHGIAVALVLLVGFVFPQLLRLGRVSTLRVLRREIVPIESRSAAAWMAGLAALLAIAFWIAGEVRLGAMVALGFVGALGVFAGLAWLALVGMGKLRGSGALGGSGWRYGVASAVRRKSASVVQISALGLGLMAMVLLTLVQADLLDNWRRMSPPDAPNRFVINIQPEQEAPLGRFFTERGMPAPLIQPMIRGRLVAVNGEAVVPENFENPRTQRLAEREFNLGHTADLPAGNHVVKGAWHGQAQEAQFSVEKGLAEAFGMGIGDVLRFSVSGRLVEAPITSLRELEWDSMRVNFFVIASPGLLDGDPASLITAFRMSPGDHTLTPALIEQFPNLSVIDVDAVVAQIRAMTDKLILIVQSVFGFSLAAGLAVLFAALQATHDEREHELAVLRTLGARNRQLHHAVIAEFFALGSLAAVLGTFGAGGAGWGFAEFVFRMSYVPDVAALIATAGLAAVIILGCGVFGTRSVVRSPPLEGLRRVV